MQARRSIGWACLVGALSALALAPSALARKPRLRIERLDAARCAQGLVDVHGVEVELEGLLRSRRVSEYRLVIDGKEGARATRAVTFAKSGKPLYLVLVVQVSQSYGAALGAIKRGVAALLDELPREARYALLAYHQEVEQLSARARAGRVRDALDRLEAQEGGVDLALVAALRRGLRAATALPPTTRRLMVVVSDGIDRMPDWDVFRRLGKRAAEVGVPIFPVAFSPIDERGPLLNLGEIGKRSRGMLRWARKAEDIVFQLRNLGRAISGQLLLTFQIPDRCKVEHRLQLAAGPLLSNPLILAGLSKQGAKGKKERGEGEAGRGKRPWRWILLGALLLLAVVGLGGMTFWLLRGMGGSKK